tara:strand:+ start:55874 stop:56596 length:723 start_codon:yes stop_codon:yes gene_type:complete
MKTYREYLQLLKDNPEKVKEMDNNKTRLIHFLFYPIALELINIPLYSPIIPRQIQNLLKEHNIELSLERCIQITKELYEKNWPKSREDILSYLSKIYELNNTDNFLKYGLENYNYDYFTLKKEFKIYNYPKEKGIDLSKVIPEEIYLPNLYVENSLQLIKIYSDRLEKELELPKDYVLKACLINYKEDRGSGFNYLPDEDPTKELALARSLYHISYSLFYQDDLFLRKLFSYEDKLKKVS